MNVEEIGNALRAENQILKIRNPLHLAINSERYKCLKVMLKSGFPIESVDYVFEQKFSLAMPSPKYITALGLAVSLNSVEAANLLLKYGANPNSSHPNVITLLLFLKVLVKYRFCTLGLRSISLCIFYY